MRRVEVHKPRERSAGICCPAPARLYAGHGVEVRLPG